MKQTRPAKGRPTAEPATSIPTQPYAPNARERAAAQRVFERSARSGSAPKFKVTGAGGQTSIAVDHPEPGLAQLLFADSFGTGDPVFADGLLLQLSYVARTGKELTARDLNATLATVHAICPRDPTEALLASQMAAIHQATMMAARRLNHSETIPQQDSASNMLTKLARAFATQVEALKRHRSTGEQTVRVTHQHVNVNAHQAVVGINQGGGVTHENTRQSHAPGAAPAPSPPDAAGPALLGHEQAVPMSMPSTGGEGPVGLPHARGTGRGAQG